MEPKRPKSSTATVCSKKDSLLLRRWDPIFRMSLNREKVFRLTTHKPTSPAINCFYLDKQTAMTVAYTCLPTLRNFSLGLMNWITWCWSRTDGSSDYSLGPSPIHFGIDWGTYSTGSSTLTVTRKRTWFWPNTKVRKRAFLRQQPKVSTTA